jgi:hypothetical protein
MHWIFSAPFVDSPVNGWLLPFVPGNRHSFESIPARYIHDRSRPRTSGRQWLDYWSHGATTWSATRRHGGNTGIITAFPQLPLVVGLRKRLSQRDVPLLAWTFNLGGLYGGPKKLLSRAALSTVDLFTVHARREIAGYSEWLNLPPEKFRFVPLQRPIERITHAEDETQPFVLAMGSARRDYRLFLSVMADLGYPTVVVASPQALDGLKIPGNVNVRHDMTIAQCHVLAQQARINVVPVDNGSTASGQVTLIESMMYARPTVATATIGTEDYAEHDKTALLTAAGDHTGLKHAILSLWEDKSLRDRIGASARKHVEEHLSDQAAGATLGAILDELATR